MVVWVLKFLQLPSLSPSSFWYGLPLYLNVFLTSRIFYDWDTHLYPKKRIINLEKISISYQISIYICVCVYVYVYMYICIHMCICIYLYIHIYHPKIVPAKNCSYIWYLRLRWRFVCVINIDYSVVSSISPQCLFIRFYSVSFSFYHYFLFTLSFIVLPSRFGLV